MFDIGFSEILLIAVVALIVVGPERLPTTLRVLLRYFQKFRAGYHKVREEVERELKLDELKEAAKDTQKVLEQEMKGVVDLDAINSPAQALQSSANSLELAAREIKDEVNRVPEIYSSVPTEAVAVPAVQMPAPKVSLMPEAGSEGIPKSVPETAPEATPEPVSEAASEKSASPSAAMALSPEAASKSDQMKSSLEAMEVDDDLLDEPPIMTDADLARWKAEVEAMEAAAQSKGEGA